MQRLSQIPPTWKNLALGEKLPQAKFVRLHQFQNDNFTYTKISGEHASMTMLFTLV